MAKIADRPNEDRAQVVERGIVIQNHQGVGPAAEFLYLNNVPFRTIVRVLADAYSTQIGHLFRRKLDSRSSANWTPPMSG